MPEYERKRLLGTDVTVREAEVRVAYAAGEHLKQGEAGGRIFEQPWTLHERLLGFLEHENTTFNRHTHLLDTLR